MSTEGEQPQTIAETKPEVSEANEAVTTGEADPVESTTKANEAAAEGQTAPNVETNGDKPAADDADAKPADTTTVEPSEATVVAPDSTPASKKSKDSTKRRSSTGIPEHKSKKQTPKKKGPQLQLEAEPGDLFLATMKGYPKWPAIICDDEMLPETLLANRPVTARRPDGTYREDFLEGGKNVRDRTYPVMYLGTYEFSWMVNTCLSPLTAGQAAETNTEKLTKSLQNAFAEAKEDHDLDHYKTTLIEFQRQAEEKAAEAAAKKSKTPKKSHKKKSDDTVEDDDEEMPDADAEPPKSTKSSSKKRKADAAGDEESGKKKMKLNLNKDKKAAGSESTPKTKASKAKTPKSDKKAEKEEESQMTDKQIYDRKRQATLYCRHKLQKAFLTIKTHPKEEDMPAMAKLLDQLEKADDIDVQILKDTKIHKVMKGITKLSNIPKDEEFHFKDRSQVLLDGWSKLLGEPTDKARPSSAKAEKKDDDEAPAEPADKAEEKKDEEEKKEEEEKEEEKTEPVEQTKDLGDDAQDEAMPDAGAAPEEPKDDKPAEAEAPQEEPPNEAATNGEAAAVPAA